MTADAGYGSEENYEVLEEKEFTAYVKYSTWYLENSGKLAKQIFRKENWRYCQQEDFYICPADKKLVFKEQVEDLTKNGYARQIRKYECESCLNCPFFEKCRSEKADPNSNRTIGINLNLEQHKDKARELLASEQGKEKRKNRGTDVETPFGNIKFNMGHRRFLLRGLDKVNIEFTLLAMAHNIRKIFCEITGCWKAYYAQRAAKREKSKKKSKN